MIDGVSSTGFTSNTMLNAPLSAVSNPRPIGQITTSLPFFDMLGGYSPWDSSWLEGLTQLATRIEDSVFGYDYQAAGKQAILSLLSLDSASTTASGALLLQSDYARSDGQAIHRDLAFRSLFPYAELSTVGAYSETSARNGGGLDSILGALGGGSRDLSGEGPRNHADRLGVNQQNTTPPQTNPLLFRSNNSSDARPSPSANRAIPWEERKRNKPGQKRDSLLGRALGKLQQGLARFVETIRDALTR